jgi:magnesium transporter
MEAMRAFLMAETDFMSAEEIFLHVMHAHMEKKTGGKPPVINAVIEGMLNSPEDAALPFLHTFFNDAVKAEIEPALKTTYVFEMPPEMQTALLRLFDRYGFLALPVVDGEQRLVGIVTVDDAMEVIREETEEDFAKMAGMTPTETPYLKTSVIDFVKARLPWLILLMLSATISGAILTLFEDALSAALVLFVPMIMATGGNSGGQSSVTVIRSLSLGEITFKDTLRVARKEIIVGLIAGTLVGVATFLKVVFVDRLLLGNPEITVIVAAAVAISLFLTIVLAKLIGALLPILAKRLGFDPAVMASPFITTLVDAASLLIYFFVAGSMFGLRG